jgi:hypothetical protein
LPCLPSEVSSTVYWTRRHYSGCRSRPTPRRLVADGAHQAMTTHPPGRLLSAVRLQDAAHSQYPALWTTWHRPMWNHCTGRVVHAAGAHRTATHPGRAREGRLINPACSPTIPASMPGRPGSLTLRRVETAHGGVGTSTEVSRRCLMMLLDSSAAAPMGSVGWGSVVILTRASLTVEVRPWLLTVPNRPLALTSLLFSTDPSIRTVMWWHWVVGLVCRSSVAGPCTAYTLDLIVAFISVAHPMPWEPRPWWRKHVDHRYAEGAIAVVYY